VEVFAPDEVAIVHVMNRVVRRCFLLGDDPMTGKNYDHRKAWIEDLLRRFAASFGIDLLGFAILSNHFHLILRSRPDVVAEWDDSEVARRWLMLCPFRRDSKHQPLEPTSVELDTIRHDLEKLAKIRLRLSDIAWWMRLLCQNIAQRANLEDKEQGRFFQSRYRAVRLLDEQAILACAAYVDLNPIRAALAKSVEDSDFTSAQRRIQALKPAKSKAEPTPKRKPQRHQAVETTAAAAAQPSVSRAPDAHLSPIPLNERTGKIGPVLNQSGVRASDKGFLPISLGDYLQLLDWTARRTVKGKRGRTPDALQPILQRLGLKADVWCELVGEFGRLFFNVAGRPQTIEKTTSRLTQQRYYVRKNARTLFAKSAVTVKP
jgi:hypothetical protein